MEENRFSIKISKICILKFITKDFEKKRKNHLQKVLIPFICSPHQLVFQCVKEVVLVTM